MRRIDRRLRAAQQQVLALQWERDHPEPTDVILTDDFGREHRTRTRSQPWMMGADGDGNHGHTAVISVEGRSGGYLLERIRPAEDGEK